MRSHWRDGERVRSVEVTPVGEGRWRVAVDDGSLELSVHPLPDGGLRLVSTDGTHVAWVTHASSRRFVRLDGADFVLERLASAGAARTRPFSGTLEAPMPGLVTRVLVAQGDEVRQGQALVAVEAMKMEHLIRAPRAGRVVEIRARPGEMVGGGVPLVELDGA